MSAYDTDEETEPGLSRTRAGPEIVSRQGPYNYRPSEVVQDRGRAFEAPPVVHIRGGLERVRARSVGSFGRAPPPSNRMHGSFIAPEARIFEPVRPPEPEYVRHRSRHGREQRSARLERELEREIRDERRRESLYGHGTGNATHFEDEDGGYFIYTRTHPPHGGPHHLDVNGRQHEWAPTREAVPTHRAAANNAWDYYDGDAAGRVWAQKKMERRGILLPLRADPALPPPRASRTVCFVTVRGKPYFALPPSVFDVLGDDASFAAYLQKEYAHIVGLAKAPLMRLLRFKTIGAVEFQTWVHSAQKWHLREVDSIPAEATRQNMSSFSYQLRHNNSDVRRWTKKIEMLLKDAEHFHSQAPRGDLWSFRIHIIEIMNAQAIYIALSVIILASTAGGLIYSYLYSDFSAGFAIASYAVTCLALLVALIAAGDYLGMERPDAFMANTLYKGMAIEMDERAFDPSQSKGLARPENRARFQG